MKTIDSSWKEWIRLNIDRGCDKDGIARILFDNGFDPVQIVAEMRYLPQSSELAVAMNARLDQAESPSVSLSAEFAACRDIDDVSLPFARRVNTNKAHLYLLDDFLTTAECDALVEQIRQKNLASMITTPDEPDKYFRTSRTSFLSQQGDPFIDEIDLRIADYLGFEPERSEGIQGQYYRVGEQFKTHTDYFEPNTREYEKFAAREGQRTWTFMIYLNDVAAGGVTEFTRLGVAVKPKKGMAVIWNSLYPDGSGNPDTAHWAKPVEQGEKYIITKWFRTHGSLKSLYRGLPSRKVPVFTVEGFRKLELPAPLNADLTAFYRQQRQASMVETTDAIGSYIRTHHEHAPAHMIELDDAMRERIASGLKPLLEAWAGKPLRITAVYGIREYQRGAVLDMHVDRVDTHHVSAIINVAQQVEADWPLHILDHKARRHTVMMQPGDMVFYESARLKHGRPEPLAGDCFANVFVHALPV